MNNQKRIKEYLVGDKGYLKSDISNGKVIMLSGKWGSGKTHFWQNKIADDELKKELKDKREVYSYTSLYGKSSIEEIENDIFSQAYSSAIGGDNFITKGFSTFTKRMKRFGSSKIANGLKEEQKDNIERTALSRLNNGGIICFDDFERKSKDIDLNDLFGFITQLTLNFKCKVVIILNDDVFEGEEKNIFSNVKEKSVSKFLMYNPSIKELFDSIFDNNHDYITLNEYKEVIFKTIEETKELNARIYIQVLDNLIEWIDKIKKEQAKYIKYLIFVNINFILNHYVFKIKLKEVNKNKFPITNNMIREGSSRIEKITEIQTYIKDDKLIGKGLIKYISNESYNNQNIIDELKLKINNNPINDVGVDKSILLEYIKENQSLVKSLHFINSLEVDKLFDSHNSTELESFQKINDFIETGIIIDE